MSKPGPQLAAAEPFHSERELDDHLTAPSASLVHSIPSVISPLIVLGAGGKMGPGLAVLARRAAEKARHPLEVIAISRFSDPASRDWLEENGVRTLSCDLFDRDALRALPDTMNLLYLVGLKFGTKNDPASTWATNTLVPANVVERYAGSRIVALSTGNVYPMSPPERKGSKEGDSLTPLGEYANAAVARERIFEFCAAKTGTPLALIRLFYAVEMRYGVLADLAQKIVEADAIDLTTGYFNCIWQGDANDMILRSLALASTPLSTWNLCYPAVFQVREIAAELGERLGVAPLFKNNSSHTALLGNPDKICAALGGPPTPIEQMIRWTADWVKRGGRNLGRPTHFEVRDGVY
jgi:nucleoside-diphosphate-sugar epimerase